MASDSFTNTNGTELGSHTAGGNTWSGCGQADPVGEIQGNVVCADGVSSFAVTGRATNSSVSYSQIVFKAGSYPSESKSVHVRSSATSAGYKLRAEVISGGNITQYNLFRDSTFITQVASRSDSTAVDHTVALKATTVGSDVELRCYIDGSPATFADTLLGNGTPGQVFTDVAADTPITSGNPGFSCDFFSGINTSNSAFDDWTDVEGSAGVTITSIDDVTLTNGQTAVTITGTGFGASQGTGRVVVSPTDNIADGSAVNQTVTAWGDTSVTFTAVLNSFAFNTTLYVFVENDADESNADGEAVSRIVASATLNFTGANAFFNEDGDPAQHSGMTLYIWRAPRPPSSGGAPDQIITAVATDASGELSQAINLGALDDGDTIFFVLFAADGTNIFSAGEQLPVYA